MIADKPEIRIRQGRFSGLASIRAKFILYFLVLSLVPLIMLAFFSYRVYLSILQANVQSYTSEVIGRVDRNLQLYLNDLEQILELRDDYYILQFINLSLAGDIEGNRKYTFRLWENLNNIKKIKTDLRDVSIITRDGVKIGCYGVTHADLSESELFQALANRSSREPAMIPWGPHPDWLGGEVFSVGRAIYGDYGNFLGIMNLDVDMRLLDRICRNVQLGKTGYIMLVDKNGRIIYHPEAEVVGKSVRLLLGKPTGNGWAAAADMPRFGPGGQVITVKTFAHIDWKIIGVSNRMELTGELVKVSRLSLALILGSIVAVILVALFLANLLTKPIKELQHSMRLASEDLNTNVTVRSNDEIGELGEAFNQMLAKIRQLIEQSVQEQKKLRRTEMQALQEQIKPHFIYNTLDLIIGLLETNKNDDVINMVEALGAFFRTSLSHGHELITIREEVEHIRNYLYIQRFRHGDKYDYRLDVDEALLDRKTIKLVLQPLVENAIYHGVRELEHPGGLIMVRGYSEDGRVILEVIDNGLGMDEEKTAEINACLKEETKPEGEKRYFGLRNVNERIILAFGREYGLQLASSSAGTTVTVRLPLI